MCCQHTRLTVTNVVLNNTHAALKLVPYSATTQNGI